MRGVTAEVPASGTEASIHFKLNAGRMPALPGTLIVHAEDRVRIILMSDLVDRFLAAVAHVQTVWAIDDYAVQIGRASCRGRVEPTGGLVELGHRDRQNTV